VKHYSFTITLGADGVDPEDAWSAAVEAFQIDPGPTPDDFESEEIEDEDFDYDPADNGNQGS
jgi:hypothetical protein